MDLSFWLTTLSLAILVYAGATWMNNAYLAPRRAARANAQGGEGVKKKRRLTAFKKGSPGSERSERSERSNAGSTQQNAKELPVNVPNVQPAPGAPAAPAGALASPSDGFTLTSRELVQLAEALHLRREGATVEEAVCRAFGVTKGGSEGYRRAKGIFDAATALPGAAPAGAYTAPAAPVRRRRSSAAR